MSSSDTAAGSGGLTTIVKTQRTAQVRIQIEDAIRRGDFQPGDRLPSERDLVRTFGVSRVSVREAIRSLEALGVVNVQHGRGAFVTDRRSGFGEPLARWLSTHRDEVIDLHRVRGALDELAAESAAERCDPAGIAKLRAALEAQRAAVAAGGSVDTLIQRDIDVHRAIAEASGNRTLYDLLYDLQALLAEARQFAFSRPTRPSRSIEEHEAVVEAIARGDASDARRAMARHVHSIRMLVVESLAERAAAEEAAGAA